MLKYTLKDILFIQKKVTKKNGYIPENVFEIILSLSSQVSAPEYIKTPVFPLPQKKTILLTDKQHAIVKKSNNKTSAICTIRLNLNKLTDKNKQEIIPRIISLIETADASELSVVIFQIASTNRFYSEVYAELFSEIIRKNALPTIQTELDKNLQSFLSLFRQVEFIDARENYDAFCENNKNNEKRKAVAAFFLNLMEIGIVAETAIWEFFHMLLTQLCHFVFEEKTPNYKNQVDEITETVAIFWSSKSFQNFAINQEIVFAIPSLDKQTDIVSLFMVLGSLKNKTHPNISNKSIFKFLDILENKK